MAYEIASYKKVGKHAKDDSKKIQLLKLTLEPHFKSKGNILFLGGFSSDFCDYQEHLLKPLAEGFTVHTYNFRGHNLSQGRFNHKLNLDDAKTILEKISEPVHILAHSYGANLATQLDSEKIQGLYCIEPLFDFDMLSPRFRLLINILNLARYTKIGLPSLDFLLDSTGILEKAGFKFNNTNPLQSLTELKKVQLAPHEKPIAFTFTDNDVVFQTNKPEKYLALIDRIKKTYPQAKNKSKLVKGLNHCLNLNPKEFAPFLKPEKGKNNQKIIEDIINFYLN